MALSRWENDTLLFRHHLSLSPEIGTNIPSGINRELRSFKHFSDNKSESRHVLLPFVLLHGIILYNSAIIVLSNPYKSLHRQDISLLNFENGSYLHIFLPQRFEVRQKALHTIQVEWQVCFFHNQLFRRFLIYRVAPYLPNITSASKRREKMDKFFHQDSINSYRVHKSLTHETLYHSPTRLKLSNKKILHRDISQVQLNMFSRRCYFQGPLKLKFSF